MRLGNGNESDSSAPTIRLATLIRGARTAAGGEMAAGGAAAQLRRPMASHALVRAREGRHARRLPPDD